MLGLAVAVVAFAGVFALGSTAGGRAAAAPQATVLVAARDIQAREVITSQMVATVSIPSNAVPTGAVVNFASLKGDIALVAILHGQYLTTNLVAASDSQAAPPTAYLPIPAGFVARAIPTSEQQGVAGYVAVDDYINVLATVGTNLFGDATNRQVTKLVFPDLHVIRVGPASPGHPGQTQGISSSLTVVMTVCDAEMMDWLLANAKLTYVLLSYHNYKSPPTAPDPGCPTVTPSKGIGPAEVNARYGFTNP